MNATVYSSTTERQMAMLAGLQPRTLATMHGSPFSGDGGNAIRNLASAMREVPGKERWRPWTTVGWMRFGLDRHY